MGGGRGELLDMPAVLAGDAGGGQGGDKMKERLRT